VDRERACGCLAEFLMSENSLLLKSWGGNGENRAVVNALIVVIFFFIHLSLFLQHTTL
jgi:hypothetical protein